MFLVKGIRKTLPQVVMIILYGYYAQKEQEENSTFTLTGDYEILVVTSGVSSKDAERKLDKLRIKFIENDSREARHPVRFVNDDINTINQQLREGRYFYTQVKKEGVILYDGGKLKLVRRRKLRYDEIQQQARRYFNYKWDKADSFLRGVYFYLNENDYVMASFHLHQVFESCYFAILLVFTLRNNKQHNLLKLYSSVRHYSQELGTVFSFTDAEEKRLFYLAKDAYIHSRYNPKFVVAREDIEALLPKMELLRNIARRVCQQRIEEYGKMN